MTARERLLADIFDQALIYHGFTDYMRDYELVVYCTAGPRTGIRDLPPEVWRHRL